MRINLPANKLNAGTEEEQVWPPSFESDGLEEMGACGKGEQNHVSDSSAERWHIAESVSDSGIIGIAGGRCNNSRHLRGSSSSYEWCS